MMWDRKRKPSGYHVVSIGMVVGSEEEANQMIEEAREQGHDGISIPADVVMEYLQQRWESCGSQGPIQIKVEEISERFNINTAEAMFMLEYLAKCGVLVQEHYQGPMPSDN